MPVLRSSNLFYAELPGRASADPLPRDLDLGCSSRIVRIAPGIRTPHRHPRTAEIVYVVSGHGIAWEDGTSAPVAAGDVIAIPAGAPHATVAVGGELVLVCFFPDADLSTNIEELDGPEVRA